MRALAWRFVLVASVWFTVDQHGLLADGGRVCWSGISSSYRLTVFAEPVPLRQGPIDLSLFVQDSQELTPVSHVEATFAIIPPRQHNPTARSQGDPGQCDQPTLSGGTI